MAQKFDLDFSKKLISCEGPNILGVGCHGSPLTDMCFTFDLRPALYCHLQFYDCNWSKQRMSADDWGPCSLLCKLLRAPPLPIAVQPVLAKCVLNKVSKVTSMSRNILTANRINCSKS